MLGEDLIAWRGLKRHAELRRQQLPPSRRLAVLRSQRRSRAALRVSRLEVRRRRQLHRHAQRASRVGLQDQGQSRRVSRGRCRGITWIYMGQRQDDPPGLPAMGVDTRPRKPAAALAQGGLRVQLYAGARRRARHDACLLPALAARSRRQRRASACTRPIGARAWKSSTPTTA